MAGNGGIPDMRFINRELPIADVARALNLRLDGTAKIHCWHPERHKHSDRTASVGIRKTNNTVKCFGCDSKPMGPIDLVMDVRGIAPADAALWIAERFPVRYIAPRKHIVETPRIIHAAGFETALGLLIRSGMWARLSPITQRLVPVLLELAEFKATAASDQKDQTKSISISYRAMGRYAASKAGQTSASNISKALAELKEIGWLEPEKRTGSGPVRKVAAYILTPFSMTVYECANATVAQLKTEIAEEKKLRQQARRRRMDATAIVASNKPRKKTAA